MRFPAPISRPAVWLGLLLMPVMAFGLLACGPRIVVPESPPVRVPPTIDLAELEQIGVVRFRVPASAEWSALATDKFVESARRDQGIVRMIDLGTSPSPELDLELGRERGVRTILAGDLTVSNTKPRVRIATDISSGNVSWSVEATLAVRLVEAESGASIWSRTASASRPVGGVALMGGQGVRIDAGPMREVYDELVDELVARVTTDFQERWVRR